MLEFAITFKPDMSPERIVNFIPTQLKLDTFNGDAWLSIAPFHMSIRARGLPVLPGYGAVPELNCRTYVTVDGKPGIYFFSLDIASSAATWGARTFYHLPYFHAQMKITRQHDSIAYSSSRGAAKWAAKYTPNTAMQSAEPRSLNHWLTERYCLYTVWRGHAYRGNIHHVPWPLNDVSVKIEQNTMTNLINNDALQGPDLASYARELEVLIWPLERVRSEST